MNRRYAALVMVTDERVRQPRQSLRPVYLLHSRPYRENSLLLELFSESSGRLGVVARSARGRRSRWQGVLQPFRPLLMSWSGRGELGTLIAVEIAGELAPLQGQRLMSGLYLNELLMRLLHRFDPHPELYSSYANTLQQLAALHGVEGEAPRLQQTLRLFEMSLLQETGYALMLECDSVTGEAICEGERYRYIPGQGAVRLDTTEPLMNRGELIVHGETLQAMARGKLSQSRELSEAKRLTRQALEQQLGRKPLQSRQLIAKVQRLAKNETSTDLR